MVCLVCYKGFGSHFLSAALGTFKCSGECFKFLLVAAIELFLANVSVKVGQRWMKESFAWFKDSDASGQCHKSTSEGMFCWLSHLRDRQHEASASRASQELWLSW